MRDIKRILISAYCQTAGLSAALENLFPAAKIVLAPTLSSIKNPDAFVSHLKSCDVWINAEDEESRSWSRFAADAPNLLYISIPLVGFHAFHPDMCAAIDTRTGAYARQRYSSKLAVLAYQRALPMAAAIELFRESTFRRLGYLDCWDASVSQLKSRFEATDLAPYFDMFYRRIKRAGQFMHTTTHPTSTPLTTLAKIIALKIGASPDVFDRNMIVPDSLAKLRWPVYPEIASRLSIPTTGYVWKISIASPPEDLCLDGLEAFLGYSFNNYRRQGLAPDAIGISGVDLREIEQGIDS